MGNIKYVVYDLYVNLQVQRHVPLHEISFIHSSSICLSRWCFKHIIFEDYVIHLFGGFDSSSTLNGTDPV